MKIKFWRKSLRTRLLGLFLLLAIIPLAVIGYLAYDLGRQRIVRDVENHLKSVAILKEQEIQTWVEHLEHTMLWLTSSPGVKNDLAVMSAQIPDQPAYETAHASLTDELSRVANLAHLSPIFLMDHINGEIVASSHAEWGGQFRGDRKYFQEGKDEVYVSGIFHSLRLGQPTMVVAAPIKDSEGRLLGVLAGHANLAPLNEIMQERSGLGETGETYLVNNANLMLTESRFEPEVALKKWVFTESVSRALAGESGVGVYDDYRGEVVIGAYRWLEERDMALLAEMDRSEAFGPIIMLRNTVLQAGFLVAVIVGFLSVFVARTFTNPLRQLVEGTEEIGGGNLDYRIEVEGEDEIDQLAQAFNAMVESLQEVTASRDELNTEIAERKRIEKALRASEEEFREIFNATSDALILLDEEGRIAQVNETASELYGYAREEMLTLDPRHLIHPDYHHVYQQFLADLEKKGEFSGETMDIRKSGDSFYTDVRGTTVRFQGQEYILAAIRDVTEQKEAELKLEETMRELERSNEELQRFAYVASHDLQEPLRMVTSYLQLLVRRYGDRLDGDAQEFIDYAVDGASRMKQLINDLLTYSRVDTRGVSLQPVDVEQVLDDVLENLQFRVEETEAGIIRHPLPIVPGDKSQLEQLFQNLIDNALKFRGNEAPRVEVGAEKGDGEWVFSVKDNGIGMDSRFKDRVFIIFQRLHTRDEYEGTGIGLAVSKRIVERHGGEIWYESEPGEGTTFYFTIPDEPETIS
ncbi:MAG: PAS domain S-box protein [Anaerolineales bacterium]|nr:PAS domain S-box protein [Anaerolineales bacterium]